MEFKKKDLNLRHSSLKCYAKKKRKQTKWSSEVRLSFLFIVSSISYLYLQFCWADIVKVLGPATHNLFRLLLQLSKLTRY